VERIPYILILSIYGLLALEHLLPGKLPSVIRRYGRVLAAAGVVLHLLTLGFILLAGQARPGFPEALSAASLGMMVAYCVVGTGRTRALGIFLTPLSLVVLGTALVVPRHQIAGLDAVAPSAWLPIHLTLIFAGLGGFSLAFVVGIVYLFVRDRLKKKRIGAASKFPSLEVLDRIQFRAMLFGFVFLTLGITAGGMWAATAAPTRTLDPKIILTLVIWVWYAIALQLRLVSGWRGRWAALFSIVGFGGLIFSMAVFNFFSSGWHTYAP